MRQLVRKLYLYEISPSLRTAFIDSAEWDPEGRRFYVGDLVVPEHAAKEWLVVSQPKPEASTPTTPPIVRKGPPKTK